MQDSRPEKFDRILVILPIILGPVILFSVTLFTGRVLYWGLPSLQFIPWRYFVWENIQKGILPFWNPLNGMGAPLLANYQLALFYPPGWLVYLSAAIGGITWIAWSHTLLVVLHLIWAGLGMTRLAKKIGMQPLAQCLCGLSFSLTGYFVARGGFFSMIWAGAWIPWVFRYTSDISLPVRGVRLAGKPKNFHLPLVIAVTFQLLAGHAQLCWYTLTLAAIWVVIGGWVNSGFSHACLALAKFALAVVVAALISSIQLLPTFEYLLQSQRSSAVSFDAAMTYSFWPWRLLSLFAPDFFGNPGSGNYWGYASFWEDAAYIGLIPVLLAISTFSVLFEKKRGGQQQDNFRPLIVFLWSSAVLGILLAFGKNTPLFPFLYRYIPSFNMFQAPSRFMIWFVLAFCILAGIGVERWHTPTGRGLYWFRLATAGTAAVTIGAILAGWLIKGDIHFSFIRAAALAGIWGLGGGVLTLLKTPVEKIGKRPIWEAAVVLWIGLDLISAGWNLNPSLPASFYQNSVSVNISISQQVAGQRVYLNPNDEYLLKFNRFFRFDEYPLIEDASHLSFVMLPNLNLAEGISSANNFDPLVPARYEKWMENLAVLADNQVLPWLSLMDVSTVERLDINNPLGVSFNSWATSNQYYWTNCALFVSNAEESWTTLVDELARLPEGQLFNKVVLEDSRKQDTPCGQASYALINQTQNSSGVIRLHVSSEQNGYLVAANTWYPGWIVQIDGQQTSLLRANYLFQAVQIPAGIHQVDFIYKPLAFYAGVCLSLLGLIGVISYKFWLKFNFK
ncbi:MAG: YfhO family protein [Anaerolineaceae bacterium]